MEENNKWTSFTNQKKYDLFKKYVENMIEDNENNYKNEIIDKLAYTKNNFILQTLKKDRTKYKNIEKTDVVIKNDIIYQIKNIEKNNDGLIYFINNKNNYKKQSKITDYNYKYRKRDDDDIKMENKKDRSNVNENIAFLTQ
jgi:hypothetical protein